MVIPTTLQKPPNYIEAVTTVCEEYGIEIEVVNKLISRPLKDKIKWASAILESGTDKPNALAASVHLRESGLLTREGAEKLLIESVEATVEELVSWMWVRVPPEYQFWEGIGITEEKFDQIVLEIQSEPEPKMIQTGFVFVPEDQKSFPLVEETYEPEPVEIEPLKEEKKGFFDWLFDLFN